MLTFIRHYLLRRRYYRHLRPIVAEAFFQCLSDYESRGGNLSNLGLILAKSGYPLGSWTTPSPIFDLLCIDAINQELR